MDPGELKRLLRSSGVDLWCLIDAAVALAAKEHGKELRARRDGIVERVYATGPPDRCRNCDFEYASSRPPTAACGGEGKGSSSPARKSVVMTSSVVTPSPVLMNKVEVEEEEEDDYARQVDDDQSKIVAIKEILVDPDQSEDSLVNLLQHLADMDITFKALEETDIGRHVNQLRKHPSNEVRRLVKQLVKRWKEIVDEWVKSNSSGDATSPAIITDGDSPQEIFGKHNNQNGNQVQEFRHSPIPHNGFLSSERNSSEPVEPKAMAIPAPQARREAPAKPNNSHHQHHSITPSSATPEKVKGQRKDNLLDPEKLASARKRLHENYQEAENAKKQRTIQVMGIHEIPKPKNIFARKGGYQARHW